MLGIWVLSKPYTAPGGAFPVAWSYGQNHVALGYQDNGWCLVYLTCSTEQMQFILSGTDPNVVYVGTEWDAPPQLLLDTYKAQLPTNQTFTAVGQVLAALGRSDPRFIMPRTPEKHM